MAATNPKYRKNQVRSNVPKNLFTIVLDGGSGTPVIATGGDRDGAVDRDRGTSGVTDNSTGNHSIHLRDAYAQVYIIDARLTVGSGESITSVEWDSTNNDLDVILSTDTADEVTITCLGLLNKERATA